MMLSRALKSVEDPDPDPESAPSSHQETFLEPDLTSSEPDPTALVPIFPVVPTLATMLPEETATVETQTTLHIDPLLNLRAAVLITTTGRVISVTPSLGSF